MKRLKLHRETLRHLSDADLKAMKGAINYTYNASVCVTACVVCEMSRRCPSAFINCN
jgi:hypothetical protein